MNRSLNDSSFTAPFPYGITNVKGDMMPLFQRTIKLTIVTLLAVYIADWLGLSYASSAGIIAILSLLDTRRSSFRMARQRLFSTLLALGSGVLSFYLFGFNLLGLGIYLLIYVPLAYKGELEAGIAPSTVLVMHLMNEQSIALNWVINEFALFVIGAGVALIFNLYMPSYQKNIQAYHEQVELALKSILLRFNDFLLKGNGNNDAALIADLEKTLAEAKNVVFLDRRNQLFHQTNYQVHYFDMRSDQVAILRQMAEDINHLHLKSGESLILSKLFAQVAEQLSEKNPAEDLLDDICHYRQIFRERELPKTRQEFETRSLLLQLLNDLERFVRIKVDFYKEYSETIDEEESV